MEEVKLAIKPYYQKKDITKDEYKDILRKAVHKICHSKSGEINPVKVSNLVRAYVQRYRYFRKHGRKPGDPPGPPGHPRSRGPRTRAVQACPCPLSEPCPPAPASRKFWTYLWLCLPAPLPLSGTTGKAAAEDGRAPALPPAWCPCPTPRLSPHPCPVCAPP